MYMVHLGWLIVQGGFQFDGRDIHEERQVFTRISAIHVPRGCINVQGSLEAYPKMRIKSDKADRVTIDARLKCITPARGC